jgi:RND family efflux transporter MFP subunit
MWKRIAIIAGILALLALVVFQLMANKQEMAAATAQAAIKNDSVAVAALQVSRSSLSRNFRAVGKFEPVREVQVMSETQGMVQRLLVKEGSSVRQGQLLAELDAQSLEVDLGITRESLDKAKADLARYETLAAGGAAPTAQLEDLKLAVKNYESRIKSLEIALAKATIEAPIGGVVNVLNIERGSTLMPGSPVATIVDISSVELAVQLSEAELQAVRMGQRVKIGADLIPGSEIEGTVSFIGVKADNAGKFPVRILIPNRGKDLIRAGMVGHADFQFSQAYEGLFIPRQALRGSLMAPSVFVIGADRKLRETPVRAGIESGGMVQVLEGLQPGEQIVAAVTETLTDGAAVMIVN